MGIPRPPAGDCPGTSVAVFGIGNPDRGDDGVGAAVVNALAGRLPSPVGLQARSGDMLALIDAFEGCDVAICVDAARGARAGAIHRIDLTDETLPGDLVFVSSHAFGLPEAFALARALGTLPGRVIVYAVEGNSFGYGAGLSPAVAAAVDDVADRVVREVSLLPGLDSEASPGA